MRALLDQLGYVAIVYSSALVTQADGAISALLIGRGAYPSILRGVHDTARLCPCLAGVRLMEFWVGRQETAQFMRHADVCHRGNEYTNRTGIIA